MQVVKHWARNHATGGMSVVTGSPNHVNVNVANDLFPYSLHASFITNINKAMDFSQLEDFKFRENVSYQTLKTQVNQWMAYAVKGAPFA